MGLINQDKNITVQITKELKQIKTSAPKLVELVKTVCSRFAECEIKNTKYEINVVIVDDSQIRKLNRRFLNRGANTDCLSFDLSDDKKLVGSKNKKTKTYELVVNGEMAARQAKQRGHSSEAELALYITHSLLHNLGFDDSTKTGAKKMHDAEDEILQQFGYGLVYNKDVKTKRRESTGGS
jgi:probable rRNA maturation factor